MRWRRLVTAAMLATGLLPCSGLARDEAASSWFDEAARSDAGGDAERAFTLYRRAAEAGLPAAEFNVAVMLDSGRGVEADVAQAATWYARAAVRGEARAAYNLGQLYQAGQGVPKNLRIARAWFAASGLQAARKRLAGLPEAPQASWPLEAAKPIAPAAGERLGSRTDGVALVWTLQEQGEPTRFFVELRALDGDGSHEVFSSFTDASGIFAKMPVVHGSYAWRVIATAPKSSSYVASAWTEFKIDDL